ncbi:MAG: Grx4 family monothiol glutaredoxin [Deltaproteobacteria bacterium]|nr:Grx4 family monothiol glutaredoxin [Deltaproteobacteria bacterium]
MTKEIRKKIEDDLKNNHIMLYMKGTPDDPQCGFSAQVVNILNSYEVKYGSRNVLEDWDLREGIKEYANWPTVPQLYIGGNFVGGCDITVELHQKQELAKLLL